MSVQLQCQRVIIHSVINILLKLFQDKCVQFYNYLPLQTNDLIWKDLIALWLHHLP